MDMNDSLTNGGRSNVHWRVWDYTYCALRLESLFYEVWKGMCD